MVFFSPLDGCQPCVIYSKRRPLWRPLVLYMAERPLLTDLVTDLNAPMIYVPIIVAAGNVKKVCQWNHRDELKDLQRWSRTRSQVIINARWSLRVCIKKKPQGELRGQRYKGYEVNNLHITAQADIQGRGWHKPLRHKQRIEPYKY